MRVMAERELISRIHLSPLRKAVEAVIEFLDTNGHHDAARALAHRWDEGMPEREDEDLGDGKTRVEILTDALRAFIEAKKKKGWSIQELNEAKEGGESALRMVEL